jgi:hypothetical protein
MNIGWVKLWVHAPFLVNKMKNKKYQTVVIIPKSNTKVPERGKIDTPNTFRLDAGTSVKFGVVKLG